MCSQQKQKYKDAERGTGSETVSAQPSPVASPGFPPVMRLPEEWRACSGESRGPPDTATQTTMTSLPCPPKDFPQLYGQENSTKLLCPHQDGIAGFPPWNHQGARLLKPPEMGAGCPQPPRSLRSDPHWKLANRIKQATHLPNLDTAHLLCERPAVPDVTPSVRLRLCDPLGPRQNVSQVHVALRAQRVGVFTGAEY